MKSAYTIYVCPSCSEHSIFAGFCDICPEYPRLTAVRVIPVSKIVEMSKDLQAKSSPVPAHFIEDFTESLVRSSISRSGQ